MGAFLVRLLGRGIDQRRMEIIIEPEHINQVTKGVTVSENDSIDIHVKQADIQKVQEILLPCKNQKKMIVLNPEVIEAILNSLETILRKWKPADIAERNTDKPIQSRPEINVEVVDPSPSGGTKMFLAALKNSMKRYNMFLVECTVQHLNEDENDEKQVLVVCNNHSRLLDDIKNTLASVKPARYCQIILLVVHMKNPPSITSQAKVKNTEECKQLCDILDIAFDKNDGIYVCDMNKMVFDVIRGIFDKSKFSNINVENDESQRKSSKSLCEPKMS